MTSYTNLPNICSPLLRNINSQGELEFIMYVQYTTLQAIPNKYCLLEFVPEAMNSSPISKKLREGSFFLFLVGFFQRCLSFTWPDPSKPLVQGKGSGYEKVSI